MQSITDVYLKLVCHDEAFDKKQNIFQNKRSQLTMSFDLFGCIKYISKFYDRACYYESQFGSSLTNLSLVIPYRY